MTTATTVNVARLFLPEEKTKKELAVFVPPLIDLSGLSRIHTADAKNYVLESYIRAFLEVPEDDGAAKPLKHGLERQKNVKHLLTIVPAGKIGQLGTPSSHAVLWYQIWSWDATQKELRKVDENPWQEWDPRNLWSLTGGVQRMWNDQQCAMKCVAHVAEVLDDIAQKRNTESFTDIGEIRSIVNQWSSELSNAHTYADINDFFESKNFSSGKVPLA